MDEDLRDLAGEVVLAIETILFDPRIVMARPHAIFPLVQRLVEKAIEIAIPTWVRSTRVDQARFGIWLGLAPTISAKSNETVGSAARADQPPHDEARAERAGWVSLPLSRSRRK